MEGLPTELHLQVCEYIPLNDLPNYRLINRTFSANGAVKLFRRFIFHASHATIRRLHAVAAHPNLHKHVQKLVWDANLWDIGEAGNAFERFKAYVTHSDLQWPIDALDRQYALYCDNIADEHMVLSKHLTVEALKPLFARLINLSQIAIRCGNFKITDDDIVSVWPEWDRDFDWTQVPIFRTTVAPNGMQILYKSEGIGRVAQNVLPAHLPFHNSIVAAGSQLKSLTVDFLSWKSFDPSTINSPLSTFCPNLTHLDLVLTLRNPYDITNDETVVDELKACRAVMKQGGLKTFLDDLKNLQRLSIHFMYKYEEYFPPVDLSDVLTATRVGLSELSLRRFETSEQHLRDLLFANRTTLKRLCFEDLYLNPQGSWIRIVQCMHDDLELSSAVFKRDLCDSIRPAGDYNDTDYASRTEDGWHLDEGSNDSIALEKYVVSGGICPLVHNDKFGVRIGSISSI